MRPFLLFAGRGYYPDGGWKDFVYDYGALDVAIGAGVRIQANMESSGDGGWWHVFDIESREIVAETGAHTGLEDHTGDVDGSD